MDRLDELTVFAAIVEHGSLAAAGRRLRRSPPAVTRILAGLEARLGARLIERSTRRIAPTEAGRALAAHARRLLAEYDAALREAAGEATTPRGRLRITAPLVFGERHVAPLVTEFLVAYPQIRAELLLADRIADLLDEEVDVAVRIAALPDSALMARRVGSVRRLLLASPDYLARRGTPAGPDDLAGHDAILSLGLGGGGEWRLQQQGRAKIVRPVPRLAVNQAEAAIAAAIAGLGIVSALSYQVADELERGRLVRLLPCFERPPVPVQLVHAAGGRLPAGLRAFLDFAAPRLAALPVLRGAG